MALIGLGLGMDASALSMTNAMVCPKKGRLVLMACFFAGFQFLMPILGWISGLTISRALSRFGGVFSGIILCAIGITMVRAGFCRDESCPAPYLLTIKIIAVQALATSIDAFAVGVAISAAGASILPASTIIGAVTLASCLAAAKIGSHFGDRLGARAQIFGGALLLALGVAAIF